MNMLHILRLCACVVSCSAMFVVVSIAQEPSAQDTPKIKGIIEGTIVSSSTQEPVSGAKIEVVGTKIGGVSNALGKFVIKNVPPGAYSLKISSFGFEPILQSDIFVSPGKPFVVSLSLNPQAVRLQAAEVEASYFRKNTETITSTQLLNAEDIRRAPGVQEDVVRAVSLLPGVAVTSAGRNDLAVRGGAPFENLFLVDNIEVPNINHFGSQGSTGGPLSIINIDFVKDVSFSTGGYGAKFGDRVSSVTNITLRDGNEERFAAKANLSATGFGVILEGPIGSNGTFMLNARRSYLDLIFRAAGFGFVPEYWDFTTKISYRIDNRNSISFLAIGALGTVSFNNDTESNRLANSRITAPAQNQYFSGLTWKTLLGNGFMNVTLGQTFTRFTTAQNLFRRVPTAPMSRDSVDVQSTLLRCNTTESETSLRADAVLQLTDKFEFSFGNIAKLASKLDYDIFVIGFARLNEQARPAALTVDTTFSAFRNATYAQGSYSFSEQLRATVGVRADYYNFTNTQFVVSPRASLSYALSPVQTLNVSGGRYYQAPQFIWLVGDPANRGKLDPFRVDQAVLGYEHILATDLKVQVETYYKSYANYPARLFRPQAILAPTGFDDVTNDIPFGLEQLSSVGTGRAFGVELFIQKKLSEFPLYGLMSVSINRTEFQGLSGVTRTGSFDTPIIFNTAIGYRFNSEWEVSGKVRAATGLPTTPFIASADRARETGFPIGSLDLERFNEGPRLRRFYALDVRVDKRWYFEGWQLVTYIDVQNITGRRNETGIRWNPETQSVQTITSIGVLPSIGVTLEL